MTCEAEQPGRLRPLRRTEVLSRSLHTIEHTGSAYTVEVDTTRDWQARLYRDGEGHAVADMPATFPVPGGKIEVDSSLYGVTRVHLVLDSGEERRLAPVAGTAEHLRAALARRYPRVSRAIGVAAILVLVVNLVTAVPTALEFLTRIPKVAAHFGTFTSPLALPGWLNLALLFAGVLAAVERVLTLRKNRVLDIETMWASL
ncbi:hypothetical protein [Amycolatopsis sp. YIM 10]|uniref:hypothetical protein n=1 Tax=Amycolatopsis sp. YIM 10 TaxID=2653857 RepID=UPI00128FEDBD|nr:hypothetical protein [Amycolatopsis sp. YIM 10]QFU92026.1 hypothetical protein YIM_34325 [Amycolatopsis sp. YIM 10]